MAIHSAGAGEKKWKNAAKLAALGAAAVSLAFAAVYIPKAVMTPIPDSTYQPYFPSFLPHDIAAVFIILAALALLIGLGAYYALKNRLLH